ncbi:unnamed protein product [Sphagnum jensenii]|uniref:Uncharacterized protein n=1 Tax=Sphagnum jensenii TaxID=128206 RepID=A0ABP0ZXM7_9BRYO
MTAENSRPNTHGYTRQPTFQRDDMNRQEESKLYGVFIDQSRKHLNNEILAMKVWFKIIYFFRIFVLPRLNQDPRTTQKTISAIQKQLSYPLSSVLPGHNATIYSSSVSLRLLNFTHERLERRRRRRSDL